MKYLLLISIFIQISLSAQTFSVNIDSCKGLRIATLNTGSDSINLDGISHGFYNSDLRLKIDPSWNPYATYNYLVYNVEGEPEFKINGKSELVFKVTEYQRKYITDLVLKEKSIYLVDGQGNIIVTLAKYHSKVVPKIKKKVTKKKKIKDVASHQNYGVNIVKWQTTTGHTIKFPEQNKNILK